MSLEEAIRYEQISAKAYEHPADRAATAALHSIPLLDKAVKYLSGFGIERLVHEFHVGNAVQISDRQVPLVWAAHVRTASVLDIAQVPDLYVTQTPEANTFTIGAKRPMVVLRSGLVRDYFRGRARRCPRARDGPRPFGALLLPNRARVLATHNSRRHRYSHIYPGSSRQGCLPRSAGMVADGGVVR